MQMALLTLKYGIGSPHLPLVHTFEATDELLVSHPLYLSLCLILDKLDKDFKYLNLLV